MTANPASSSIKHTRKRGFKRINKGEHIGGQWRYYCKNCISLSGYRKTLNQRKKATELKDAVTHVKSDSGKPKKYQSTATGHKHKQLDLSTTLVKMWEQFRKHKCSNRAEILQNILTIIKGRVKEVSKRKLMIHCLLACDDINSAKLVLKNT